MVFTDSSLGSSQVDLDSLKSPLEVGSMVQSFVDPSEKEIIKFVVLLSSKFRNDINGKVDDEVLRENLEDLDYGSFLGANYHSSL